MMNNVRNTLSPTMTCCGGTVGMPIALRVSDSTITMRVKMVHSTSRLGAIDITVSSRMMTTEFDESSVTSGNESSRLAEPGASSLGCVVVGGVAATAVCPALARNESATSNSPANIAATASR